MDYQTNQYRMKSEIRDLIDDLMRLAESTHSAAEHARDAGWINAGRMLDAQMHIYRGWAAELARMLDDQNDR